MNYSKHIEYFFLTLMSGIFAKMAWDVDRATLSIETLNVKIAQVVDELHDHEIRIRSVESRGK
jgi:hypothetical protein